MRTNSPPACQTSNLDESRHRESQVQHASVPGAPLAFSVYVGKRGLGKPLEPKKCLKGAWQNPLGAFSRPYNPALSPETLNSQNPKP